MGTDRGRSELGQLLTAVRSGRVTPSSARQWARRAAAGQSIAVVSQFASAGPGPAEAEVTRLADDLAAILASGGRSSIGAEHQAHAAELSDAEADQLWPPRTEAEAAARQHQVAAAAAHAAALTDEQMIDVLFGPPGSPGR